MGSGFSKKKKEAKVFQDQFSKMKQEMQTTEITGLASDGLVAITLNGEGDLIKIKIKPECVDLEDIEGLETLIKMAHDDAQKKIQKQSSSAMPSLPSGLRGIF
jgi:nucleoid-associated protein EbfC